MGTMPRNQPMAQPMTRSQPQSVTGGRTTAAQRQAMTPFRNNLKAPMAKMNPMTYGPNLAQQGLLPAPGGPEMTMPEPAPNMLEAQPSFGGAKSMPEASQPPQPFNLNPNPVSNMGGGGMPQQQFNGQLDLSGMFGQQSASMIPQQQYQNYNKAAFGGGKTV